MGVPRFSKFLNFYLGFGDDFFGFSWVYSYVFGIYRVRLIKEFYFPRSQGGGGMVLNPGRGGRGHFRGRWGSKVENCHGYPRNPPVDIYVFRASF